MSTFLHSFEGLWRRPIEDYRKSVKEYRISVDTNVLLELYRFTPKARAELLDVLRQLKDRLWIPHQVAAEYYDRRVTAVKEHLALYESVPDALEEQKKKALQELHTFAKRCAMGPTEKNKLVDPIEKAFNRVGLEIANHRKVFDLTLERVIHDDPVLAALAEIFDGRTGLPFSVEVAAEKMTESQRRADEKVPPGYKDAGKNENAHGDYFVWEQLLIECEKSSAPLLFVTNDAKEDWVRKEAGLIVGARPELLLEYRQRCHSDFLITQLGRFLQIAKEELGVSVSASTVAEAENPMIYHSRQTRERITMPESNFSEFINALRHYISYSKRIDRSLSPTIKRQVLHRASDALRIEEEIMNSHRRIGNDISFRIDTQDWKLVHELWHRHQQKDSDFSTSAGGDMSRNFSSRPSALAELENRLGSLRREQRALMEMSAANLTSDSVARREGIKSEIDAVEISLGELLRRTHRAPHKADQGVPRVQRGALGWPTAHEGLVE